MTIHLMTSSKKGVSSLQISRELGITVKSAWFMTHRIREAMIEHRGIGDEYEGGHSSVNHSAKEYVNPDGQHTNTAESFFALLKRGHYGIFHMLSKQHLPRYSTEFSFRWNHRKESDGERMTAAIKGAEGKRLMYRQPNTGNGTV